MSLTLPTTNNPEETYNILIYDNIYGIRQLWNINGFWTIDISDKDGNILIYGVKIVTGINLLRQYPQVPFDLIIDSINYDPGRFQLEETVINIVEKE